jgi:hypothetical protein
VALIAILVVLATKFVARDINPAYARAKDEFLIAYNKNGDDLWRKHIGYGYDLSKAPNYISTNPDNALMTIDIDGDGKNEVLGVFGWVLDSQAQTRLPLDNTLICFGQNGEERWKYEFHRSLIFGKEKFSDDYRVIQMMVGDFDRNGQYEIVFVAQHGTWPSSFVVHLNAKNGTVLSEYWHPGWTKIAHKDMDGDGVQEILVAGYNNAFEKSAFAILDSRRIEGHAPATDEYIPQGISRSTEKSYILLPDPDLYVSASDWDQGSGVSCDSSGLIEIRSGRIFPGNKAGEWVGVVMFFYFDKSLNCVKVKAGDDFINYHVRLEKEGKLTKKLDNQYFEELRRGVLYWNGKKFDNQPTMNMRHNGMVMR